MSILPLCNQLSNASRPLHSSPSHHRLTLFNLGVLITTQFLADVTSYFCCLKWKEILKKNRNTLVLMFCFFFGWALVLRFCHHFFGCGVDIHASTTKTTVVSSFSSSGTSVAVNSFAKWGSFEKEIFYCFFSS